jgi:hypothetical protein
MAIAPSKLGRLIYQEWHSDDALIRRLRETGLVRADATSDDLQSTFRQAREEHSALSEGERAFNSPNERVRVFLAPFLTRKGKRWAVPLDSLKLSDRSPWWRFWA